MVIDHRKRFIGLKGFDYSTLEKKTLSFIPPLSVYDEWKRDYETMQVEMIYGDSLPFDAMISDLQYLNERINQG